MTIVARHRVEAPGHTVYVTSVRCDGPHCDRHIELRDREPSPSEWEQWTLLLAAGDAENKDFCCTDCFVGFCRQVVKAADVLERRGHGSGR